jgi:hypothetical protein
LQLPHAGSQPADAPRPRCSRRARARTRSAPGRAAAKANGKPIGNTTNPKQAKQNKADALARAQALRPHIERCIRAGRTSSSAIATDLNARDTADN